LEKISAAEEALWSMELVRWSVQHSEQQLRFGRNRVLSALVIEALAKRIGGLQETGHIWKMVQTKQQFACSRT
jgi:hypothetical protein